MQLASWVRARVWYADDWREALARLGDEVVADSTTLTAARALELAQACELVEPDRRRALAMYCVAWRMGSGSDALERARQLAREVGAYDTIAELALGAYETSNDAAHLVTAGTAWIDAGSPDLAVGPLSRAAGARPRDEEVRSALAAVKRELRDPTGEVSGWVARASRAGRADAARIYLHAARLARVAGLDDVYARLLDTGFQRGRNEEIAALIEDRLFIGRRAEELQAFYRSRLEAVANDRDWVDTMRAAATKLMLRGVQRGLAIRLLRSGLEHAYRARLVDVPGHLASWDLLIRHARETRSTRELMPLVVEALGLPVSDDDRLYLSRFGFEVTWRDARDFEAARPYAAAVAELVPDHPGVRLFVSTELVSAMEHDEIDDALAPTATEPPARESLAAPAAQSTAPAAQTPPAGSEDTDVVRPQHDMTDLVGEIAQALDELGSALQPAPGAPPPTAEESTERPVVAARRHRDSTSPPAAAPPPTTSVAPPTTSPAVAAASPLLAAPPPPAGASPPPPSTPLPSATAKPLPALVPLPARLMIPAAAMAALRAGGKPIGVPAPAPMSAGAARAARRIVPIDVELLLASGVAFSAVVRDLSTTGVFIVTERLLDIGAIVSLELHLPGADLLVQSRHRVSATVVRRAESGYGLVLLEPSSELVAAITVVAVR